MRLRSDTPFWQRVHLRLTRAVHEKRITKHVQEFSNGNPEYAEYVEAQIRKTRAKRFANARGRLDPYVDLVLKHCVDLAPSAKILSLGTRNHFELDALKDRGLANVTGLDLWPTDSRILKGDMHDLPFEDNTFDLIFASHVFEHAYDFEKVARQCVRVLKKGGYLFCAFPVRRELNNVDRIDYGTVENFITYFPEKPELVLGMSAFYDNNELRIILRFNG